MLDWLSLKLDKLDGKQNLILDDYIKSLSKNSTKIIQFLKEYEIIIIIMFDKNIRF